MYSCNGKAIFSAAIAPVFSVTRSLRFDVDLVLRKYFLLSILKTVVLHNICRHQDAFCQDYLMIINFTKQHLFEIRNVCPVIASLLVE